MTKEQIKEILLHREPMLLVDEIHENEDGTVTGEYTVRGDEFFLKGHFPDNPIVPGVILCEMAAQCSCLLVGEELKGKVAVYAGMNKVKFKSLVRPGDTVKFTCAKLKSFGVFQFMKAEGYVGDRVALTGEFSFALLDPSQAEQPTEN